MRKILALIALVMLGVLAFGQNKKGPEIPYPNVPIDEETNLVTYKEVVQQANATPQELFDRAMTWVKKFYKNTAEVIKSSDRDKGVIQLRSSVRIYVVKEDGSKIFKNIVYYNMKIECRSGRYRYTITDFNEKAASAAPVEVWLNTENPKWEIGQYAYLNQIDEQILALIESLEEGMNPPVIVEDEW
ncbi:MAG: DUF4468 domain-containing protein [Bacteroidales bacterium]|jgi:hypothetical protein|nr:DUF4468 domain-containing protein [Bacteroidales bacterium]